MRSTHCSRFVRAAVVVGALLAVSFGASGCFEGGTGPASGDDGDLVGELSVQVSDDFDGTTQTHYALTPRLGQEYKLLFDTDPRLQPGIQLAVRGVETPEGLRVISFHQVTMPIERVSSALQNGIRYPAKRLAFVLVDIGGGTNLTLAAARAEVVGPSTNNDPPLKTYYIETSYGTQDLDGQAFGPFPFSMNNCNTSGMATALRPMVDAAGGGTFNHYLWYIGQRTTLCQWAGLGQVGRPDRPARDTWYNASSGCVVMVQEPGHNFGMQHSSSMDCGTASFADDPSSCTHNEYGDRFDPMGGGCRHMNGWQKAYNGWLQGCNVVEVHQTTTMTLLPLELPCDGVQLLQVAMPRTRPFAHSGGGGAAATDMLTHYFLELRSSRGIDNTIANSVLVHVGGDLRGRADRGLHTWILDMNPATTAFDGMLVGQTFNDPAGGVTFAVRELDASHATVDVTLAGAGTSNLCLDGTSMFTGSGPGIESCAALPASVPGTGGTGGAPTTTGAGGRGGAGGAGGRGGAGGSTTATGTGGTGGSAGGLAGSGGTSTGVDGGTAGTGGPIATGTGGTTAGTGNGGSTGGVAPGLGGGDVVGGCGCDVSGTGVTPVWMLALAALSAVVMRRRRRR